MARASTTSNPCTDLQAAAARHDYVRIWRKVRPAERDRRIAHALARLAEGETLAQVAATWSMSGSALCRALLAYAPGEWRRALAARAIVKYEAATDEYLADPRNPVARGRAWATRWHLEHALSKLGTAPGVSVRMPVFTGDCPNCSHRSVCGKIGQAARCYRCEWEGDAKSYLLGDPQAPRS